MERVSSGSITVAQRGTDSGEYDTAWAKGVYEGQRVIDYDFGALVYPKWIKVTSSSEVVSCVVNFSEGGGSGTGGGSGEAASTMLYLDINREDKLMYLEVLGIGCYMVKYPTKVQTIATSFYMGEVLNDCIAVSIDPTASIDWQGNRITIGDLLQSMGVDLSIFPKLTKEQFYTI